MLQCGSKRCEVCKYITETDTFTSTVTEKTFQINYGKNVPRLEVFELVLVQCSSVDDQYQKDVLYTFTLNKPYAHFLNVEPSKLVFLKT